MESDEMDTELALLNLVELFPPDPRPYGLLPAPTGSTEEELSFLVKMLRKVEARFRPGAGMGMESVEEVALGVEIVERCVGRLGEDAEETGGSKAFRWMISDVSSGLRDEESLAWEGGVERRCIEVLVEAMSMDPRCVSLDEASILGLTSELDESPASSPAPYNRSPWNSLDSTSEGRCLNSVISSSFGSCNAAK